MFHVRCGESVKLSNDNKTASRNLAEFNYGLVLSCEPLINDELFEVRIDKKIYSWSGSLEIGVTSCSPNTVNLPPSATDLRNNTWILSASSILKDGVSVIDRYGVDLDKAIEGDRIGIMRTSQGELVFYVNGVSYGIAAENIPPNVYAVVDLYGKVAQVTITSGSLSSETEDEAAMVANLVANLDIEMSVQDELSLEPPERIRFHHQTGSLVKLSCNARSAERLRPLDEFNNGVVMTHRALLDDQLFEIRIDRLVEKWSGSIEVGVTTHNPNSLDFPATMTNMRSGTIMMSGCGILTNGKGTRREYGEFNLDELRVGDRIGMMRKSNSSLHLYINGLDQGVAATRVPLQVWGVVDLYGMTVKVTIVDRDEREEHNLITRRNTALRDHALNDMPEEDAVDRLMFHIKCGGQAAVINNNRTAHRPNATDDFNNGVVLTHRPLKTDELFEVRLDKMVPKWAGSIEIGVTTHSPTELEYPSTMTNVRSGTWMMTGNGVMHNGTTIIDEYGQNLDRLQVGDRVGVVLRDSGTLHFLVNGVDQGEAATNISPRVYGVIDLYGQAAQATIVDHNCLCCLASPDTTANSTTSLASRHPTRQSQGDLHFHHVHGRNARVSNGGRTASRPRALGEFNDAIVMSNRSLNEDEMFAVVIEKIVDRWSGSIEAGVTAIRPDDLELPGTMTDLDHDTWMLSGSSVMQNGVTLKQNYSLDLDSVQTGAVVGMKRHSDGSLHYYLDGEDRGEACTGLPPQVYPVIDLYGQCAQVSIVSPSLRPAEPPSNENSCSQTLYSHWVELPPMAPEPTLAVSAQPTPSPVLHRLSPFCGKNITMEANGLIRRNTQQPNHGMVLTTLPMGPDELFEVVIEQWVSHWAGSLAIGLTCMTPTDKAPPTMAAIGQPTWYITGDEVYHSGKLVRAGYCRSLAWLRVGARVGVKRCGDGTLHFYINGQDQGVAAHNVPKYCCYGVLDLYGGTTGIRVTSKVLSNVAKGEVTLADAEEELSIAGPTSKRDGQEISEELKRAEDCLEKTPPDEALPDYGTDDAEWFQLHEVRGRNVQLSSGRLTARRVGSYNQGVVLTNKELLRGQLFQVRIDAINPVWVSSLCIGVTSHPLTSCSLPVTSLGLKRDTWIICSDFVFHDGQKIKTKYGPNLDNVGVGRLVGVVVDHSGQLHLYVDGVDQGVAAPQVPPSCRVVLDIYGRCEQVTVVNPYEDNASALSLQEELQASIQQELSIEENIDGFIEPVDFTAHEKADLECHEKEKEKGGHLVLVMDEPSRSKIDKTNENIQSSSMGHTTPGEISPLSDMELDPKSIASNENLTLQQLEQQQNADISRHIAQTNCDHKTSCDLANTSYIKSPGAACALKPLFSRSLDNSLNSLASNATPLISPAAALSPPLKPHIHCEYLNACLRLKDTLGLPGGFFSKDWPAVCYCESCYSHCAAPLSKGDPPALSTEPAHWCRLPLRRRQRATPETDQWHVAYAGSSLGAVRRILDLGQLLMPEQISLNQERSQKSKHDQSDSRQLVLSPTIKYAACTAFAPKHEYIDPKTKKRMVAYAAFQVLVRPSSYKVGPPSLGRVGKPVDPLLEHDATEWVTKERNSTVLTTLLFKLEQA